MGHLVIFHQNLNFYKKFNFFTFKLQQPYNDLIATLYVIIYPRSNIFYLSWGSEVNFISKRFQIDERDDTNNMIGLTN